MKAMGKISRGRGFRGVLEYVLKGGPVVGGNMTGSNARKLAKEFGVFRGQRPEVEKPVWHSSLRLPQGETLSPDKWVAIADEYMSRLGFVSGHPKTYVIHDDAKGQHLHIVSCRVAADGKLYLGQNENLKSTKIVTALEKEFGLTITPGQRFDSETGKVILPQTKKLGKNELNMATRTGATPPRERLQNIVSEAVESSDNVAEFLASLKKRGVIVLPNIAKTGKMNGLSYEIDGVKFTGTQLGQKYKWQTIGEKLGYSFENDNEKLLELKKEYKYDATRTVAKIDGQDRSAGIQGSGTRKIELGNKTTLGDFGTITRNIPAMGTQERQGNADDRGSDFDVGKLAESYRELENIHRDFEKFATRPRKQVEPKDWGDERRGKIFDRFAGIINRIGKLIFGRVEEDLSGWKKAFGIQRDKFGDDLFSDFLSATAGFSKKLWRWKNWKKEWTVLRTRKPDQSAAFLQLVEDVKNADRKKGLEPVSPTGKTTIVLDSEILEKTQSEPKSVKTVKEIQHDPTYLILEGRAGSEPLHSIDFSNASGYRLERHEKGIGWYEMQSGEGDKPKIWDAGSRIYVPVKGLTDDTIRYSVRLAEEKWGTGLGTAFRAIGDVYLVAKCTKFTIDIAAKALSTEPSEEVKKLTQEMQAMDTDRPPQGGGGDGAPPEQEPKKSGWDI